MARFLFSLAGVGLLASSAPGGEPPINFNRDIRPILSKSCFPCHGPDEGHRKGGLRLDLRDAAVGPRKSKPPAITPGKPGESLLVQRITATDEAERMPPPGTGMELAPAQIELLKKWIAAGAEYAPHWAFVPPVRPPVPASGGRRGARNEMDAFVLARLREEKLEPSPEADRYILLRRASLDLRGLPPSHREVEQFEQDLAPGAYERAVDRFLADSAYGERWARVWLDLARYADSAGFGSDPLRPNMWRYRDWVIEAFNRNLPYDQFTIEQLAGDLLPRATLEQRIATAFHRNTMTNTEGGTDDEEFRTAAVKDRADTTMQVWMGLTFGCAKCHSHKYDPIANREYYQIYAYFNQTADNDQPDERPTMPAPTPDMVEQNRRIDAEAAPLQQQLDRPRPEWGAALAVRTGLGPPPVEMLRLSGRIARLNRSRPAVPNLPIMAELDPKQRRSTRILVKGDFLNPGDPVEPAVPAAFHPLPKDAPANRLALARWLVDPANPLTARVAVNRLWGQLFGVGLVETEEDFGTQGELPSHPELLDWLATEYVRLGWDTKAILRLMVTSATYRQSSRVTPELLARDPRNRLLARGPRFRLEAEMVRDQALALSGLLSRKVGGPSVYPPQPPGLWQAAFNGQRTWATSTGEDRYRRGLYTFWRRTIPYPSMTSFDAPSRETCSPRRVRSNTPLQALVTLNDPVYVECAQALARRIVREGGSSPDERIRFALRLCLCRPPEERQVRELSALFEEELKNYRRKPAEAAALATEPIGPLPAGADAAELAAWTVVANVLLNLDSILVKG